MSDSDPDVSEELEEEEEEEEVEAPSKKRSKAVAGIDDEADDEDDEDEDDEEEERDRGKKRRKGAEFIDDMADVEDDDEDDDDEDEGDDLINDEEDEVPDANEVRQLHARVTNLQHAENHEATEEELQKFIKERYANRQEEVDVDDWDHSEVEQQGLLPTVRDPKLWMVRCRPGRERETVICLMQKYINKQAEGDQMLIKSALCQDKLKGYVYVEADKESHVMAAIQGMATMFVGRGCALVPIREMVDVVTVAQKAGVQLQVGAWVRVRGGTYKKDLAKVLDVDQDQITIQLLPRIDIQALVAKEEGLERKKSKYRPPARPFSAQECREARIPVERRRDHNGDYVEVLPNGHRFQNGYHVKVVSIKSITTQNVDPTFDELQKYNQAKGEDNQDGGAAVGDIAALSQALDDGAAPKPTTFTKGDAVVVKVGDLKTLRGRVVRVEGEEVTVMPQHKELNEELKFQSAELEKYFEVGAHVKVTDGTHRDETGLVVRVEDAVCVLFTDTTKEEVKVFAKDLVECTEVSSGLDSFYGFEIHDLVALDQTTVGMIIKVEREAVVVLTNHGAPDRPDVRTCRRPDLKRKIFTKNAKTTDQNMQQVGQDSIVEIASGPSQGRRGTVKHVQRGQLFIHCREEVANGGILCVRARNCRLHGTGAPARLGGGARAGGVAMAAGLRSPAHPSQMLASPRRDGGPMGPPGMRPAPGGGAGGGSFGGHRPARRDDAMLGARVKVKLGPYKGYKGTVVDATQTTCRVELEDPPRTVTINRSQLGLPGGAGGPAATPLSSPYQWNDPTRTPHREAFEAGGKTPMHSWGAATPMRDDPSRTPLHDPSRTPMRDSAWNPNLATPTHTPYYADDDAPTPSARTPYGGGAYSAGTPGGNAYTPSEAGTPADVGRGHDAGTPGAGYNVAATPGAATPGGDPYGMTPGMPTPGGGAYTPGGAAMTPGTDGADPAAAGGGDEMKPVVGLFVEVRGQAGVVKSIDGPRCRVRLEGGGEVDALASELVLVTPVKKDPIVIVKGEYVGQKGQLIGVDGTDGIVKMGETLDIHILDLSFFGKLADE